MGKAISHFLLLELPNDFQSALQSVNGTKFASSLFDNDIQAIETITQMTVPQLMAAGLTIGIAHALHKLANKGTRKINWDQRLPLK